MLRFETYFYLEHQYLKFPAGLKDTFLLMVARYIQIVANYINVPSPWRIGECLPNKDKVVNLILVIIFNWDILLFDGSLCTL
jgi:hypothetical protein